MTYLKYKLVGIKKLVRLIKNIKIAHFILSKEIDLNKKLISKP